MPGNAMLGNKDMLIVSEWILLIWTTFMQGKINIKSVFIKL